MNCNPCCGCFPHITTYNPSAADNFPTILQQVEYLKALLKKYPSQQWFITQEKVTEETVKLDSTKISLRGRVVAVGDFILGNTVDGIILIFQYTGVMTELTYYVVEYVGIYANYGVAEQALDLAKTNERDIGVLDGQVAELEQNKVDKIKTQSEYVQLYGVSKDGKETVYEGTELNVPWKFVRRDANGNIQISSSKKSSDAINRAEFDVALATKQKILSAEKSFVFNGKEVKAPSFYGGEMLVSNGVKTLFGNQSIFGKGNIDLYRHYVAVNISNVRFPLHIVFYSSNSLECDSLTDLKTILGNTFEIALFGSATTGPNGAFSGNFLSNEGAHGIIIGSSGVSMKLYSWTDITITDTVTTI